MESKHTFFEFTEAKQRVNQWLCIAFLALWCFWLLLYFATQKAEAVGREYSGSITRELWSM